MGAWKREDEEQRWPKIYQSDVPRKRSSPESEEQIPRARVDSWHAWHGSALGSRVPQDAPRALWRGRSPWPLELL